MVLKLQEEVQSFFRNLEEDKYYYLSTLLDPRFRMRFFAPENCELGVRKSGQENTLNCSTSAEENLVPSIENISPANGFDKPACDSNQPGVINHSRNTAGGKDNPPSTSLNSKLSPIQRRPHNTQSNTCYKYKSLADIKSSALSGDLERVNLFAVVHQIPKELTKTSSGKFTKICKIIDESLGNRNFNLHFFVPDDVLIKQIEIGDILRLHRVKDELTYQKNKLEKFPTIPERSQHVTSEKKKQCIVRFGTVQTVPRSFGEGHGTVRTVARSERVKKLHIDRSSEIDRLSLRDSESESDDADPNFEIYSDHDTESKFDLDEVCEAGQHEEESDRKGWSLLQSYMSLRAQQGNLPREIRALAEKFSGTPNPAKENPEPGK
ncbi:hypothetical protein J6590_018018 [Homalodisca vitripennis]|nr:hypothetical protein J6590_018018 [Homalodisca vitripennis]